MNHGDLVVTDSAVQSNLATSFSGAFYSVPHSKLRLIDSIVCRNTAGSYGGAMILHGATTMHRSQIYDNTAPQFAAIYFGAEGLPHHSTLTLTMINCTVAGNIAVERGGGLVNSGIGSQLVLIGSRIVNNRSPIGAGVINLAASDSTVVNTTFEANGTRICGNTGEQGVGVHNTGLRLS